MDEPLNLGITFNFEEFQDFVGNIDKAMIEATETVSMFRMRENLSKETREIEEHIFRYMTEKYFGDDMLTDYGGVTEITMTAYINILKIIYKMDNFSVSEWYDNYYEWKGVRNG